MKNHAPTQMLVIVLRDLMRFFTKKSFCHQGFFAVNGERFLSLGQCGMPSWEGVEWLCGWRHGNSFPMTQSAQSHRQMRSIPLCPKAVFYVFVFDSTHDSGNNAESIPRNVPLNHRNAPTCWGGEIKKRKSGVISFFCSRDEGIRTLDLCNVTAAL